MSLLTHENRIISLYNPKTKPARPFAGFAAPTSNTTFAPNQFFDACLPYCSRGVVRLVGYLIRKTLGWCDSQGNPQQEQISVSYRELITKAGISRDMVREALDETVAGHFIECVGEGRANVAGEAGHSASYQLRWDAAPEYRKKPADFQGYFEGQGNRMYIPNQSFDVIVPKEPLSVIKTVGAVIRFSIGFQAKHGRRRQQVALSYKEIERYARIGSPTDLSRALRTASEPLFFKGQLARWQAHRSLLDAQDSHLEGHQATHAVQAHLRPRSHAPPRVLIVRGSPQRVARRTLPDMIRRLDPAMRRIITEVPQPRPSKGGWGPLPIQKGPLK